MKKLIILLGGSLCGMLFWMCSTNREPEIFIPLEYREMYDMDQRKQIFQSWGKEDLLRPSTIEGVVDTTQYMWLLPPNLQIRDILTKKEVINVYDKNDPADRNKFAMYTININIQRQHLLFFNHGEFTVFDVDDYPRVLKKIARYFRNHKEVDARLLPLCIQEATKIYVQNGRSHNPGGPWRHWWGDEADSLGRIYNQYLRYY